MANPYDKQVSNRNFLSPVGFKFTMDRAKKVSFLGNSANIPGLTLGVANQATPLKDIDTPGDKILFDDFTLRFLVDENLENYLEIYNWIRGLGYPESLQEIIDFQRTGKVDKNPYGKEMDIYSDGTLIIQTSNFVPNFQIKFRDLWPYSLTTLNFDATNNDVQYFTADVTFKYTIFDITDLSGKPL
jgi:hypothetical protein|tara:strand:+ start:123 stop:680 length:558 start_codon:yes stop_codon:yes gene_type:complete